MKDVNSYSSPQVYRLARHLHEVFGSPLSGESLGKEAERLIELLREDYQVEFLQQVREKEVDMQEDEDIIDWDWVDVDMAEEEDPPEEVTWEEVDPNDDHRGWTVRVTWKRSNGVTYTAESVVTERHPKWLIGLEGFIKAERKRVPLTNEVGTVLLDVTWQPPYSDTLLTSPLAVCRPYNIWEIYTYRDQWIRTQPSTIYTWMQKHTPKDKVDWRWHAV